MAREFLYAVPDPSSGIVVVFERARGREGANQVVDLGGQRRRVHMRRGLPKGYDKLVNAGSPPPFEVGPAINPKPPCGPCLHCGALTEMDGVANSFWASDYSPAGHLCPSCGGVTVYL